MTATTSGAAAAAGAAGAGVGLRSHGGAAADQRREPRWVIAGHVFRSARRWAVLWGAVFGLLVISTVAAFVKGYPTVAQRLEVARALQSFAILLGTPRHAETVAGFTQWRVLTAAAIIGAIWGLRTSTGLLRGEEDAGRWELLLAGRTTQRRATGQALLGLGAALAVMLLATTMFVLASTRFPGAHFPPERVLMFVIGLVAGAAMFLAIGALTSQIAASRGQAATLATAVLGAAYAIRMAADTERSLGWLRWLSPLGWLEELRPLREPQPLALVPVAALVCGCAGLAILLAGRRDLGASVLEESPGRLHETRWLIGPVTLALRLTRGGALAWLAGVAALSALEGSVARSAASILTSSPQMAATLRRIGVRQGVQGYLGASFFFVAIMLAVLAATQIAALRDEEASGRLDNLLVRPVRRLTWLAGRLGVSLGLIAVGGLTSGVFTWLGAASRHTGVALPKLLEAGLNAAVPAVFVLGAGALVFGLLPRLSAAACYGIVAYSFLVTLVAALIKGNEWVRDTSLFAHIALAPATKPDWPEAAGVMLMGLAGAVIGAVAFQRRDVEYA